ncbi:hypothetical protein B0T18DRAFT_400801 [Schizothecium vesticola]|uniref:Uncharacterized protein n=1 Tax=Schizothecium vesticola TaxID=314040 RepID=A0AA40KDR3_9PEZI|nr:hypothetical protein B0T18DRAFT_400801 [Schizothecium vesticola]
MEESCLRAWEMRRSITGTEVVRIDVPKVVFEDCLMFLEVGLAQDLISELFPADKRMITPSCCPDHFSLTGASVETIFAFFGPYLFQAIDQSKLREWEKEEQRPEITECVEVQLRDPTSRHGILKLRIGWSLAHGLVNSLYT